MFAMFVGLPQDDHFPYGLKDHLVLPKRLDMPVCLMQLGAIGAHPHFFRGSIFHHKNFILWNEETWKNPKFVVKAYLGYFIHYISDTTPLLSGIPIKWCFIIILPKVGQWLSHVIQPIADLRFTLLKQAHIYNGYCLF